MFYSEQSNQKFFKRVEDCIGLKYERKAKNQRRVEVILHDFVGLDLNHTPPDSPVFPKIKKFNRNRWDDPRHKKSNRSTSERREVLKTVLKYSQSKSLQVNKTLKFTVPVKPNVDPGSQGSHYCLKNQNGTRGTPSPFKIPFRPVHRVLQCSTPCSPGINNLLRMPLPANPNITSPFRSPYATYCLTSPVRSPPILKYSPVVPSLFSESPTFGEEWQISDYYFTSEDDRTEEERNYKYWCRSKYLLKILEKQSTIDGEAIFGSCIPISCDLDDISPKNGTRHKRKYRCSNPPDI